jgi:hypothetical protein
MRLSLILLIIAAVGVGVGLGLWIHVGAGITFGSLALAGIALFRDDGKGHRGGRR